MTLTECYNRLHGDYDSAVSRMMNERLVQKFLLKFPSDDSMDLLRTSVANGNRDEAFRAAHTLKGVAANLSFSELFSVASELTEQLRNNSEQPDSALVARVEECYKTVIDAIEAYQSEM